MKYVIREIGADVWSVRIVNKETGKPVFERLVSSKGAPVALAQRLLKASKAIVDAALTKDAA